MPFCTVQKDHAQCNERCNMRFKHDLSQVSTKFELIEPGDYQASIEEVRYDPDKDHVDDPHWLELHLKITEPGDYLGRKTRDRIYFYKNDGDMNEYGLAQLKRYVESTLGEERANSEDFDPEELVGQSVILTIGIREGKAKKEGEEAPKFNEVKRITSLSA